MSEEVVSLPPTQRGAWALLSLVGAGVAAVGLMTILGRIDELKAGEPLIGAFLALGAGLFLSCFGVAVPMGTERPATIELGAEGMTLVDPRGDEVTIPWSEVKRAAAFPAMGDNSGWVVTLEKGDGGVIEVVSTRAQDEAQDIARRIEAGREAKAQDVNEADADAAQPEARLEGIEAVTAERMGEALVLTWSASVPWRRLLFMGPFLGMMLIAYGFYRYQGGFGPLLAMGFMAFLLLVFLVFSLKLVGVRQRVSVDGRELTIEQRRGQQVVDRRSVPVFSVVGVDYTHRLNVVGANLNLRTRDAQDNKDRAMGGLAELEGDPNPVDMARAISALMNSGVQVPLGGLSLPAKIAVDLALSAEVARRTGKSSAAV